MEDFTHLRKARGDNEKETALLEKEMSATDAKQCLDKMKEINVLIS